MASGSEQSVNSVHVNPQNADQIVVCSRAPTAHVMTLQGQVVKTFQSGGRLCCVRWCIFTRSDLWCCRECL